jgi:hypothetical protein
VSVTIGGILRVAEDDKPDRIAKAAGGLGGRSGSTTQAKSVLVVVLTRSQPTDSFPLQIR